MTKYAGEVLDLFISQKNQSQRTRKSKLKLTHDGVIDDKFYAKDIERSILLTSIGSYELALKNNVEIAYGILGENILIDYNPYSLSVGSQVTIGEVLLQVTQNCTICNHLSSIDKILPTLLKDDRGIFLKVVKSGLIEKGDKLYLL